MVWHHDRWMTHVTLAMGVVGAWLLVALITFNELAAAETLQETALNSPDFIAVVNVASALTAYAIFRAPIDWALYTAGDEINEHPLAAPAYFAPVVLFADGVWMSSDVLNVFGVRFAAVTTGCIVVIALIDWRGKRWLQPVARRLEPTLERWGVV